MKWMVVVLVGGVSSVNTDLIFDKFGDCLSAEEQMRQFEARLLRNVGTCVPHGGGDQQPVPARQHPPATSTQQPATSPASVP